MTEVDHLAASQLEALAAMRSATIQEVQSAQIDTTNLTALHTILLLILTNCVSVLDSGRILLEHGYSEQAHGLTRALYDAEIDVALLAAKPEWVFYYVAYEAFDMSLVPGRAIKDDLIIPDDLQQASIEERKEVLRSILDQNGTKVPEDWDQMDLLEATRTFAKAIWNHIQPTSWRPERAWDEIFKIISDRQYRAIVPGGTEEDLEAWRMYRPKEHYVAYSEMSARLHGSPRVATERWPDLQVGGFPNDVPRVAAIAATHFVRIHHLIFDELGVAFDREMWSELLARPTDS